MKRAVLKRLDKDFKRFIRERDKVCQQGGRYGGRCGGILHCSHIHSVGAWPNLKFTPLNAVGLCFRHHLFWWHKEPTEATEWIRDYLGEANWHDLEEFQQTVTLKGKTEKEIRAWWY